MTWPFASARVTIKTFGRDGDSSPPTAPAASGDWAGVLTRYAVVAVDDGWLRLLGAGGHGLPALFTPATSVAPGTGPASVAPDAGPASVAPGHDPASAAPDAEDRAGSSPSRLVVGFDVLGGTFALGDGVEYFAPDGLAWLPLGLDGLDDLVDWALAGGLADTFAGLRWSGWAAEIRFLAPDQGVSVHPPLWSEEGQDIDRCVRGVTPLAVLVAAHHEAAEQLLDVTDGEQVTLDITD